MGILLKIGSITGLFLTVIPSFLVWYGVIEWNLHAGLMFAGMVMWFATAPLWINKKN